MVLEIEIVARDAGDGLRLEAREARDAVVLVDDDVAGAQVGEGAQRAFAAGGEATPAVDDVAITPAAEQPVLG